MDFEKKRLTTEQILALRRIVEGIHEKNLSALITITDFKKAFDAIYRRKMVKIVLAYGIPEIIVHAIEDTYQNTRAKFITPDGETDEFSIQAGILHGDTLAPSLFIVVLDCCFRTSLMVVKNTIKPRKSRRVGPLSMLNIYRFELCG